MSPNRLIFRHFIAEAATRCDFDNCYTTCTGPKREIRLFQHLWRAITKRLWLSNKSIVARAVLHVAACDMLRGLVGTTAPGLHDCSIQE
ncbi:hypothetical protein TNCV_2823121 [Trichonephila clavipes]|nr:hypothetical protein TNCV_2823121 [Trichonephila clavipes]